MFTDRTLAPKITCHVLADSSDTARALAKYAQAEAADLVCVGSRGMGAFKSTMYSMVGLGSVSNYLVHHSDVPVLVCKLPHAVTAAPDRCDPKHSWLSPPHPR